MGLGTSGGTRPTLDESLIMATTEMATTEDGGHFDSALLIFYL